MFYVGQKVVCVNAMNAEACIALGKIYTVYQIEPDLGGLQLEEVSERIDAEGYLWYFYDKRFRPLVERKTDISVFTALLNPARHVEKV